MNFRSVICIQIKSLFMSVTSGNGSCVRCVGGIPFQLRYILLTLNINFEIIYLRLGGNQNHHY